MRIYQLNNLPEEVISHAFAKTSRSAGSFDKMAESLTEEKSAGFHEKWVLNYGHSSVAEHSVAHIAMEGLTRPVIEAIESCRLASYTEQSTRYQPLKRDNVYFDENWHSNFKNDYNQVMGMLFGLYDELMGMTKDKNACYDIARFALPLGATANVGMTINLRALRRTICKLMAHELPEAKEVAQKLIEIGTEVAPTLLKHIAPCKFEEKIQNILVKKGKTNTKQKKKHPIMVSLKRSHIDLTEIIEKIAIINGGSFGDRISCSDFINLMWSLGEHDSLSRALEYGYLEFTITSDYGSYYDMKRHRMATIIPEKNCSLNFVKPSQLADPDNYFTKRYLAVMKQVKEIISRHLDNPEHIYMMPNAAQKTFSMLMNPREWAEVVRLRGFNPDGHPTYRAIGLQMYEKVIAKYPFMDFLEMRRKDKHTSETITDKYELI